MFQMILSGRSRNNGRRKIVQGEVGGDNVEGVKGGVGNNV